MANINIGRFAFPPRTTLDNNPAFGGAGGMSAANQRIAHTGRVKWNGGGTHNIRKVIWRTGTVTVGTGSTLRVSLQDVSLVAGAPGRPDGVVDQSWTGAISAGNPAASTEQTTTLTTDRTVADGELLAVVWDYSAFGATTNIDVSSGQAYYDAGGSTRASDEGTVVKFNGSSWSIVDILPNVIFEDDTGTVFGHFEGTSPCAGLISTTIASNTNPKADGFQWIANAAVRVYGVWADILLASISASDYYCEVYEGTDMTPIRTGTAVARTKNSNAFYQRDSFIFSTPLETVSGTNYKFVLRPVGTSGISMFAMRQVAVGHWAIYTGAADISQIQMNSGGTWNAPITLRRPMMGMLIDQIGDGAAGGAAFIPTNGYDGGIQ